MAASGRRRFQIGVSGASGAILRPGGFRPTDNPTVNAETGAKTVDPAERRTFSIATVRCSCRSCSGGSTNGRPMSIRRHRSGGRRAVAASRRRIAVRDRVSRLGVGRAAPSDRHLLIKCRAGAGGTPQLVTDTLTTAFGDYPSSRPTEMMWPGKCDQERDLRQVRC
jgi:hypothetical protein